MSPNDHANEHAILDKVVEILRKISEILSESKSQDQTQKELVSVIAQSLKVDDCSFFTHRAKTKMLELTATYALNQAAVHKLTFRANEGLVGYAFQLQQTLNIANHRYHPRYKGLSGNGEDQFGSFLAVPLNYLNQPLGVLVVMKKSVMPFDTQTVDTVRSLSTQLGNMIFSSDLFEKLIEASDVADAGVEDAVPRQSMFPGFSVSPGLAFGRLYRVKTAEVFAAQKKTDYTDSPDADMALLTQAIAQTKQQTLQLEERLLTLLSEADASIFTAHILMLDDHLLNDYLKELIINKRYTAESAVCNAYLYFEKKFQMLPEQVFRERINDLKDILLRLTENLTLLRGKGDRPKADDAAHDSDHTPIILLAEELLPSELMRLPIDRVRGIVCQRGSVTSHTSILAKALDIPSVVGVAGILSAVQENDQLLVDAQTGTVCLNPDEQTLGRYDKNELFASRHTPLDAEKIDFCPMPATSADHHEITVRANISLLNEINLLNASHAQGIGLYRTEFLYMMRENLPSEQDQFNIYSKLAKCVGKEYITIRVLDVGADKPVPCIEMRHEENPALGVRGVRLVRDREDILMPHLRAILRACTGKKLKILLPMVSTAMELLDMKAKIMDVKTRLENQNVPHATDFQVGLMLETPSMLFELETVLREVDFVSVGTNDLSQYFFAADRGNGQLAYLTNPLNPMFLRALRMVAYQCYQYNTPVSICGEMASFRLAIPILVGLGFYELSVSPKRIANVRDVIACFTFDECRRAAEHACNFYDAKEVEAFMENEFIQKELSTATISLPRMPIPAK